MNSEGVDFDRVDLKLDSLMRQRRYYRKFKIPALEQLFDAVKGMIGPQAGTVLDGPGGCPPETEDWLAHEYLDIYQSLGLLGQEIGEIEYQVKRLSGRSVEELESKQDKL